MQRAKPENKVTKISSPKTLLGSSSHRILAATARPQIAGQGPASLTGLVSDRDFAGAGLASIARR